MQNTDKNDQPQRCIVNGTPKRCDEYARLVSSSEAELIKRIEELERKIEGLYCRFYYVPTIDLRSDEYHIPKGPYCGNYIDPKGAA